MEIVSKEIVGDSGSFTLAFPETVQNNFYKVDSWWQITSLELVTDVPWSRKKEGITFGILTGLTEELVVQHTRLVHGPWPTRFMIPVKQNCSISARLWRRPDQQLTEPVSLKVTWEAVAETEELSSLYLWSVGVRDGMGLFQ